MKLFNTLTKTKEELKPLKQGEVSLYTCGPTVYDYYHIGNLRNAIFNDTLRRTLQMTGLNIKHLMNITDVGHLVSDGDEGEDKLQKGAKREGKTVWEVAEHYTEAFKNDMKALNILPPNAYKSPKYNDSYARATEFIDQQIEMVELLLKKDYAYITKQAVYFDVAKIADYGSLSGQSLADKEVAARSEVVTDDDKSRPQDFAVWFFATGRFEGHTMHWPSPWGDGFPGWHLECSAIIHAALGDPIDIHTGGVDHIGTHHPNEIAQTKAAYGNNLAELWVHNEFILVDGQKMSKSKNNSYHLSDITKKNYSPFAFRLMALQAHYRSELNFSWEILDNAEIKLKKWQTLADLRWQTVKIKKDNFDFEEVKKNIKERMFDDLNTPEVVKIIDELCDKMAFLSYENLGEFEAFLKFLDDLFGLDLAKTNDIEQSAKQILLKRQTAKEQTDYNQADELREILKKDFGLGVNDTGQGQIWFRL